MEQQIMTGVGQSKAAEKTEPYLFKKNKYNAKRKTIDGINFSSMAEAAYYEACKLRPEVSHIDVHIPVTLPCGSGDKKDVVRYNIDFIVWIKDYEGIRPRPEAVEIKGKETPDFKIKRKLFDSIHPLSPLKVLKKQGKKFIEI